MRIACSLFTLFLLGAAAHAQQNWPLQISFSGMSTSLPPGILTRVLTQPFHPGITLGSEYSYSKKAAHEWFQTARAGYFYHRYNQHAIQIYSELGYRYHTPLRIDVALLMGGGYVHSIRDQQLLERKGDGTYRPKANWGQPQAMLSSSLEAGYTAPLGKHVRMRFFIGYQFWLQTPFVKKLVPLLPHTVLRFGTHIPLHTHSAIL